MQGLGTELGILNAVLYVIGAALAAWFGSKLKVLIRTDLEKMVKRHKIMWAHYVKEKMDETGDIADLLD